MDRQFNLAIVGLGGMGNWHRETIAESDNISVFLIDNCSISLFIS